MKIFGTFLAIVLLLSKVNAQCSLPAPSSITFSNIGSCQITANWDGVVYAGYYTMQYKISTDTTWTTISNVGLVTSYTITGLSASTSYKVRVAGTCNNNVQGAYKTGSRKTTSCSTPTHVTASNITASSATISWNPLCGTSSYNLKYKIHSSTEWITISNISTSNYSLINLQILTSYDVVVLANCSTMKSKTSPALTFTTSSHVQGKNVLLILIDDSRQDPFAPDGGPSFFSNPNISRIAYEGVRFKLCFPSESQCAPSRSSIYTGLYPHKTGILNNMTLDSITQTTLAEILHSNNYYTGLIGKYHLTNSPQPGYDYWMENTSANYFDQEYNVNGIQKIIPGHKTDVVTDSAIGFLQKVPPGKSFYLQVAYAAPHIPHQPRPQDATLYLSDQMPVPDNDDRYSQNYGSFLYPCNAGMLNEENVIRSYYQMLAGVEYSIGRLLTELTSMDLLDSTLIIFTSDNGYLLGEHHLDSKRLAYEESLKLPLYMRYPPKITAGTVIDNEMAMNIDLAPTILDYVNIPNPVVMDGISLKQVINGTQHRNELFYEFFNQDCDPDIRAVRSLDHKYVQYGCNSVTEEFFDLNSDPKENTNLINNSAYDSLINVYRGKLEYWENYYDYPVRSNINCYLKNPVYEKISLENEEDAAPSMTLLPNPASSQLRLLASNMGGAGVAFLTIKNVFGEVMMEEKVSFQHGNATFNLFIQNLPGGIYLLSLRAGAVTMSKQLVIGGK